MPRYAKDKPNGTPYDRPPDEPLARQRRRPFDQEVDEYVALVIAYWRGLAPPTADAPVAIDRTAERITPSTDRNCAAVFTPAAGLPLVAMNSWNDHLVLGGGAQNHAVVYAAGAYQKVQSTKAQLHAEMKILGHCFTSRYAGPYYYIGISKPCCLRCAVVMQIQGFGSRGCSGGLWDAGWAIPDFVRNDAAKLTVFMGAVAYTWYNGLSQQNKNSFLLRLQTAKD